MQTELEPVTRLEPPSPRRGRWVMAAALGVVVLLIGGSVALFGGGTDPEPPVASTTTAAPTTTVAPARQGGSITIEVLVIGATGGDFTITGVADVCSEGEISNIAFNETDTLRTFTDRYTCEDGSGTFDLVAEINLPDSAGTPTRLEGTFTIVGGTGDYEGLTGSGSSVQEQKAFLTESHTGEVEFASPSGG